jgi:hypothetical protein
MRWSTLSHIHLDRVAACWLIRRFVDPDARFTYVEWGLDGHRPGPELLASVPAGDTAVGIPGARLGLHDENGTCFAKVLRAYGLEDPALWSVEQIVAAGVRHALGTPAPDGETEEERTLGAAMDMLGAAYGVAFDDAEHLELALPLYDALYTHCQTRQLPEPILKAAPSLPPLRTRYLREALAKPRDRARSTAARILS